MDHSAIESREYLIHTESPKTTSLYLILKRLDATKDSFEKFKSKIDNQIESMWSRLKTNHLKNESTNQKQKGSMFSGSKLKATEKESSRINGVW